MGSRALVYCEAWLCVGLSHTMVVESRAVGVGGRSSLKGVCGARGVVRLVRADFGTPFCIGLRVFTLCRFCRRRGESSHRAIFVPKKLF